jgi:hypothetical protein
MLRKGESEIVSVGIGESKFISGVEEIIPQLIRSFELVSEASARGTFSPPSTPVTRGHRSSS